MKRILAITFALCLSTAVKAEEPKKFFLEDDGSTSLRVEKIESKVTDLEKRVAALEKSSLKAKPIVNPLTSAAPKAVQYKTVRTQVCTNGRCSFVDQLVPLTDLEMAALSAPIQDCPNCTTCVGGCTCFGGGLYCADGKCPVSFGAGMGGSTSACTSGNCGSSERTGWYLGKRLGR